MMFAQQFDSVVRNLMSVAGGTAKLKVFTDGVYSDGEAIRTSTEYTVNMILQEYPQNGAGDKSNFGTLILEGDKQCLVQPINKNNPQKAQPVIKANKDVIVIAGVEWKILNVKEVNPSSTNCILFDLHIRK